MLIIGGFAYSVVASIRAYRETGKTWMLFLPHWIDANSGVSAATRRHGKIAFAILFAGMAVFLLSRA
jgi:hypothetical protein